MKNNLDVSFYAAVDEGARKSVECIACYCESVTNKVDHFWSMDLKDTRTGLLMQPRIYTSES